MKREDTKMQGPDAKSRERAEISRLIALIFYRGSAEGWKRGESV